MLVSKWNAWLALSLTPLTNIFTQTHKTHTKRDRERDTVSCNRVCIMYIVISRWYTVMHQESQKRNVFKICINVRKFIQDFVMNPWFVCFLAFIPFTVQSCAWVAVLVVIPFCDAKMVAVFWGEGTICPHLDWLSFSLYFFLKRRMQKRQRRRRRRRQKKGPEQRIEVGKTT